MTYRNRIIASLFATAAILTASSAAFAAKNRNVLDIKHDITDSNIVYPESYELDTQKMLEGWYMKNYTATDDRYRRQDDVQTSDAVIRDRLSKLNTVIEMPFNQIVRSYIDRYTSKNRAGVAAMLGLSLYYMPIFEQALEEEGLPQELKYLPVIESALDPNAVSHSGASGLWQFMVSTGKGMGLEVNSLVDERRDPYLSSKKAAQYLKSLYSTYGDWSLAIAAYNCGPGTVNKAIRRAGGDPKSHDYWSIYYFLPSETRGYVPMFIAANYVMNYYQYHNISPVLATKPLVTDTLMIGKRVHFNQISKVLDIPLDELRVLNPQFRADIIPGHDEKFYTLVLPSQQIHAYIMSEPDILSYEAARYAQRTDVNPGENPDAAADAERTFNADEMLADETPLEQAPVAPAPERKTPVKKNRGSRTISHKVEPGQSLYAIAQLYDVSVDDIKTWNNLTRNNVRTGQQLRITTAADIANNSSAREVAPAPAKTTANKGADTASQVPTAKKTTKQETPQASAKSKNQKAETAKAETTKATAKAKTAKAASAAPASHTIKSGENLTTIAKKYGTTVAELQKANNMKGDALRAGDQLKIPATKASSATSSKSTTKGKTSSATKATGSKKGKKKK
ncbi:MAG: transglycosylase SLT domain-containing protein [Muribaculaceae bacterium]|nr:transglycosylase SLT domain-containing protein [Muribaculaceae bacterium]